MKSVLLVEDDRKLTMAIAVRLKAMGYEVSTAADAITAVSAARKSAPDVVVIDINLPGGDGFVVAKRLQLLNQTAATPVVFMTASKKPGLEERAKELGAVAFLEKPFDAAQLSNAIESASFSEGPFQDALQ
jgi:CheY-like chemotaxis protein